MTMHPGSIPFDLPEGLIEEMAMAQVLGIQGHVTVEIVDDHTGRVVQQVDGDNYVNASQWQEWAKSVQRAAWQFGYQGANGTVGVRLADQQDARTVPTLRNDHLACWSDATAEDGNDKFPFGEVIAWGHRWPQGSLALRQGVVNPLLCTMTETTVSWVWEWTTTNGNGNFQSVGWRRLTTAGTALVESIIADAPLVGKYVVSSTGWTNAIGQNVTWAIAWTLGTAAQGNGIYWDSGTASLWQVTFAAGVTKLQSCPLVIDANGFYSLAGQTVVDQSAAAFATGLKGNGVATTTALPYSLTRIGTDWVSVGYTGNTTTRRPFIARVTNAGVTTYTNANAGTYAVESGFTDVTYDGTDLWVTAQNGNAGTSFIHRINPATGTISATISAIANVPVYWPTTSTSRSWNSIEWDATNLWFWVSTSDGYQFNMDSSGNWLGVLLFYSTYASGTLAGTQLVGGQATGRGSGVLDRPVVVTDFSGTGTLANAEAISAYSTPGLSQWLIGPALSGPNKLCTVNGGVCGVNAASNSNVTIWSPLRFDEKPCFATRSLLGAPAVKTNTQTMRIRYTITYS